MHLFSQIIAFRSNIVDKFSLSLNIPERICLEIIKAIAAISLHPN